MEKVARLIEVPPGCPVNEHLREKYAFLTSPYVYYTVTVFNNNPTHVFVEVFGKPAVTMMDEAMVRRQLEEAAKKLY